MERKDFLVTNRSGSSITLMGRTRIEIPGNCTGHVISLAADRAQAIVSRLKRAYPLLKIVAAQTARPAAGASSPAVGPAVETAAAQAEASAPAAVSSVEKDDRNGQAEQGKTPPSQEQAGSRKR